jgi:leucyl-tRNA synthetase
LAEEIQIPVQVNGKVRAVIQLASSDLSESDIVKQAISNGQIKRYTEGKKYRTIYVKGKILNIVVE